MRDRNALLLWPAASASVSVVACLLPWSLVGSRGRSPLQLLAALRASGLATSGWLSVLGVAIECLPVATALLVLAAVLRWRTVCVGLGVLSGCAVLAIAVATLSMSGLRVMPTTFVAAVLGALTLCSALGCGAVALKGARR